MKKIMNEGVLDNKSKNAPIGSHIWKLNQHYEKLKVKLSIHSRREEKEEILEEMRMLAEDLGRCVWEDLPF